MSAPSGQLWTHIKPPLCLLLSLFLHTTVLSLSSPKYAASCLMGLLFPSPFCTLNTYRMFMCSILLLKTPGGHIMSYQARY